MGACATIVLMLTAYVLYDSGRSEILHDAATIGAAWADGVAAIWVDVAGEERPVLEALGDQFGIERPAIEDCFEGRQRPRIDEYDDHFFLLMYDPSDSAPSVEFSPNKIGIFFGPKRLMTVHPEPVDALEPIHRRYAANTAAALQRGLDFLLYMIIDGIVDDCVRLAENYEDNMDALEERSLAGEVDTDILEHLSQVRRDLIAFRRYLSSLRETLRPFAQGLYRHLSVDLEFQFRHVTDHVSLALEVIEGLREATHAIHDNYFAQLAERTNALMRTLTLFSTFLLPLALITGFYGMNIILVPSIDSPWTTVFVLALLAVTATCMYVYFRRRKFL